MQHNLMPCSTSTYAVAKCAARHMWCRAAQHMPCSTCAARHMLTSICRAAHVLHGIYVLEKTGVHTRALSCIYALQNLHICLADLPYMPCRPDIYAVNIRRAAAIIRPKDMSCVQYFMPCIYALQYISYVIQIRLVYSTVCLVDMQCITYLM